MNKLKPSYARILVKYIPVILESVKLNSKLSTRDTKLITEVLYYAGQMNSKIDSEERQHFKSLLEEFLKNTYEYIDPTTISDFGIFYTKNGYYCFNFNSAEIAYSNPLALAHLKMMGFSWNRPGEYWQLKQSETKFNIELLTTTLERAIEQQRRLK